VTRALVVHAHPLADSLVAAARERVLRGLAAAHAEVRVNDLYADGFEPEFTAHDKATHKEPGVVPALQGYVDDLRWCDTLVLVYPTWWSGQPAILKGWIDRVWVNGVAWELPDGADRLRPALRNVRRIVVVTTHGSPKWVNAIQGEGGKRTVTRSLRSMCHPLARTSWLALYGVDRRAAADRAAFLDRVESRLADIAR
jgi:putative NADPH-quinone reductase